MADNQTHPSASNDPAVENSDNQTQPPSGNDETAVVKFDGPEERCIAGHLFRDGVDIGEHDHCCGIGCTEPNEAIGETRSISDLWAQPGEQLLRKSATWEPENDTDGMTVPEMVLHIYSNRKSKAVAPNGHTCPFITTEEHTRLAKFMRAYIANEASGDRPTAPASGASGQ